MTDISGLMTTYTVTVYCHTPTRTWLAKAACETDSSGPAVIPLMDVGSFTELEYEMRMLVALLTDYAPNEFTLSWVFADE